MNPQNEQAFNCFRSFFNQKIVQLLIQKVSESSGVRSQLKQYYFDDEQFWRFMAALLTIIVSPRLNLSDYWQSNPKYINLFVKNIIKWEQFKIILKEMSSQELTETQIELLRDFQKQQNQESEHQLLDIENSYCLLKQFKNTLQQMELNQQVNLILNNVLIDIWEDTHDIEPQILSIYGPVQQHYQKQQIASQYYHFPSFKVLFGIKLQPEEKQNQQIYQSELTEKHVWVQKTSKHSRIQYRLQSEALNQSLHYIPFDFNVSPQIKIFVHCLQIALVNAHTMFKLKEKQQISLHNYVSILIDAITTEMIPEYAYSIEQQKNKAIQKTRDNQIQYMKQQQELLRQEKMKIEQQNKIQINSQYQFRFDSNNHKIQKIQTIKEYQGALRFTCPKCNLLKAYACSCGYKVCSTCIDKHIEQEFLHDSFTYYFNDIMKW
ncbi:Hypothetical_protein [Hexamita inflata]|uniref:Hypothetical_protein n=1 Tax=Hexamita inflata TaxID=28002 RepID=A0AA86P752_9EUKA|nr:Hypothetical protein HINF_LOCUS19646 [Hexamita inflata]